MRSLTAGTASALFLGTAGMVASTSPADAFFDRYVLVQPIQVCDDSGNNCAGVQYFHLATAETFEQANVLPIFLPLSQFNDTALLNSNDGPSDFSNGDGGSGDPLTINMWFSSLGSIVDCGGPGTNIVGCAFRPGKRAVIDGDFAVAQGGDISIHTGTHSNLIAHEMGHNFGLPHVGDGSTLTTRLMNPIVRTDSYFNIGVSNFLLTAGEISTIRSDSKAQTAADCVGDGNANNFNLTAGTACLNVFAQGGNDVITLNFGSGVLQDVQGDSGDDLISILFGSIVGDDVEGGSGNDALFIGGIVMDDIFGGSGSDFIDVLSTAQVVGNVDGGSGNDLIVIAADPADILGGTGDDVIILNTGAVADNVYGDDNDGFEGDDGADVIVMNDGMVFGDVDGEGANDIIRIFGGQIDGDVSGSGGADTIEIAGGVIGGDVRGGNGIDAFVLSGGSVGQGVSGGNDNDSFLLTGTTITGELSGGNGDDSFTLAGGSAGAVSGGNNSDTFLLTGTSITGDLNGGNGSDIFTLEGGSVGGDVDGGNDSDTFLLTGTTITGDLNGGNHSDTLTLAGGSIGGDATGGNGSDTILLLGTLVGDDVDAGNNNDVIIMTAGSVGDDVFGGFGNDLIQVLGGTVNGSVFGDEGNDVIATAEPGTVLGNIDGGDDDDTITIASDPVDVLGGTGDDVINIVSGAVVTGSVYGDDNDGFEGDDGDDAINLTGGSIAGSVFGEGGDDTAVWTGTAISVSVDMGGGTDTLDIYGVNAGGTAFQAGLTVLDGGDDASSADGEIDTLNLRGVVEVLTDLQNWEFINLVDTSIGDLGQASRTIVTEQFFIEAGSALVATGNFGSTQSYVIDGDLANDGFVDMRDGAPSYDVLTATGIYTGGAGSVLRTDTFLGGPGSPSDLMVVGTATAGETGLFVFDTNAGPGAYNPEGIPIVDVSAGTTDESHFVLVDGFTGFAGPIDKGLFFYDLALRPDNVHVLIGVPDLEAFQMARIPTQMQSAWHSTTGVWHDRTADLRAHLEGSAAPGPKGPVSPGFWVRGVRSYLDRDDETTFALFNKSYTFNTSYDQDINGVFAGADWAWNGSAGDAGMLGVFAGYTGWDSRFKQRSANGSQSAVDGNGPSFGLYATWLNRGFFADGVFKVDLPEIDVQFPGVAPAAPALDSADAVAIGGIVDSGYRHAFASNAYVEGLGTLAYVSTDIDPVELAGSVIDFGSDQSLRGRLGLAVSGTFTAGDAATLVPRISASVWHEFDADNGIDIASPGGAPLNLGDDFGGTFGEISGVVNIFNNHENLSFFVKTDYRFGEDMSEIAASLGLRYTP